MAIEGTPFTLGKTATRVFYAINDNPGSTARDIANTLAPIDIGQVRMVLRTLRKKGDVLNSVADKTDPRMIRYTCAKGSVELLELGIMQAAERKAARGARAEVEPMEVGQFHEALLAVARYDILITRYTGLANRDKREHGELPVRSFDLEGEEWKGVATDLVKELRARRAVFASLPEYRAALKLELDQLVTGGDVVDVTDEVAA